MFEVSPQTDETVAGALRMQAARCRRLAAGVGDDRASATLERMALEYDEKVRGLDRAKAPP